MSFEETLQFPSWLSPVCVSQTKNVINVPKDRARILSVHSAGQPASGVQHRDAEQVNPAESLSSCRNLGAILSLALGDMDCDGARTYKSKQCLGEGDTFQRGSNRQTVGTCAIEPRCVDHVSRIRRSDHPVMRHLLGKNDRVLGLSPPVVLRGKRRSMQPEKYGNRRRWSGVEALYRGCGLAIEKQWGTLQRAPL